jgi:hypothetical protein
VLPAILLAAALLPACTSPERLTAESLDCAMRDVEIVPSVFARKGSKTAWCATCAGKRYLCATNAERSRTVCKESVEGDGCL